MNIQSIFNCVISNHSRFCLANPADHLPLFDVFIMSAPTSASDNCVSSELYEEFDYVTSLPPSLSEENVVSRFTFHIPGTTSTAPVADADGDLLVTRRHSLLNTQELDIHIEHSKRTELSLVGLQVWRGALLLADWLIHNRSCLTPDMLLMELGSGVGLTSIVASMFAPVVCTDLNKGGLFNLIESNVKMNFGLVKHPIVVEELDFSKNLTQTIENLLPRIEIIFAADVVYDNDLTDAFIATLERLMRIPCKRSIYIALEKRYVFTIADCAACAPCYDYFTQCLRERIAHATIVELPLDFPQYFHYERVREMALWCVTSTRV